ncbi:unnamed protein product [Nippostrongylus brasiliensis]|uniref:Uncharacterized calcium-binding protein (inferred by orthology to a C. elegans protein) n=1 Tax=Nippostrongylus brasiliensis TaxID=27835 RepID=A0A0N4YE11_NIPBR|nr:unnamed protein product [Nippostrongylus brasiliensis]
MPAEKDNVFWRALLEHKVPKKKLRKKNVKLSSAKQLAVKYNIAKDDVDRVAQMLCGFGCDVSPKVVQAVMRSSDKSGDGEIDFEEFLAAVTSKIEVKNIA